MATPKVVTPNTGEEGKKEEKGHVRIRTSDNPFVSQRHPWENRKALSDDYEGPVSGREGWWRSHMRETPQPGRYQSETFLDDLGKRPNTYRFRSDGRSIDPHPHGKGALLLPGAYDFKDFLQGSASKPATYNFKSGERDAFDVLNFGKKDKDINVSPNAYNTEQYLNIHAERTPSKHFMFKSQSRRFPTFYFKPKIGPGPGMYDEVAAPRATSVSSCFRSKTPRFSSSHTKIPGPGTYDKTFHHPMKPTISKMGRQYGLFFTSAFQA